MKNTPHLIGEMIAVLTSQGIFIFACFKAWEIRTAIPLGRILFGFTVLIALVVGVAQKALVQGG